MQIGTKGSHELETRRIAPADDARLKILIERLVREGRSDQAIAKAVCEARLG